MTTITLPFAARRTSPANAAASFDMFPDYAARGRAFMAAVRDLVRARAAGVGT